MIECDCSRSDFEPCRCSTTVKRKASKEHKCCECHEKIKPGECYEVASGIDCEGEPFRYKTCLACAAIRERYCSGGWIWGELAEQIEPCIECDYRELPHPDDADEIDAEDAAHVERHRKKTAVANG